jgi:Holliday junction resolvasome RuvABC endonuclease subunit
MIIGIDCGYRTGGVALVGDDWAEVHDLPTYSEGGVDVLALMDIIKSVEKVDHIYIERQQAMPRQGVVSTFKLGYGFGQISSTCALSKVPFSLVSPAKWKRALALPKDKDSARRLAQQWFPELSERLKRKKDEHRAEALLIAKWGKNNAG